ncbi:MAG: TatD family hydrolase [Candidatus Woesearchaeota archaeon]|jgi:TatD DNase family protein|nr:TatD family hydrolase [Candidatus Woesearchaeota archaeon]MDP7181988.1 TatD family hydrolase [Candidatus Woesearchaeota archaeon]MDP7198960.1 TatD family hydrolase [Candidatus Woesearchaeota archaeon]MDP7467340.1 TatD family hydrolase [Candidatus Woesearchaeota archaeon]MDP7646606.1 TatD family hydrolase [Candidatus Woesearchaeota archaeon]
MLTDVHCHLTHGLFDDLDKVIQRARDAGVKRIITAGTNNETNKQVIGLTEKYPDIVRASLGMYPLDALGIDDDGMQGPPEDVDQAIEYILNNKDKIVGVGEIGMDFKTVTRIEQQIKIFKKFVDVAKKIGKPVIVHSRKAEKEVVEVLGFQPVKSVLHCFGGRKSLVKQAAEDGMYFSIPPILLRSSHFEMIVNTVNINQLLTETDAPWLNNLEERNEPANVSRTVERIAKIKGLDTKEAETILYANYQKVFKD